MFESEENFLNRRRERQFLRQNSLRSEIIIVIIISVLIFIIINIADNIIIIIIIIIYLCLCYYYYQRNCILENIRQEIYAKIGVSLKNGVNFAFVLTPKSAVKIQPAKKTYILH